jgi:hypothetical protein
MLFLPVYWPLLDRFWLYHIIYDVAKASPLIYDVVIYKIKEVRESLLHLFNHCYYYFNQMKDKGDGSINTNDDKRDILGDGTNRTHHMKGRKRQ